MTRSTYRPGQSVTLKDGRTCTLVRRNVPYLQWLVKLSDGRLSWFWESEFVPR